MAAIHSFGFTAFLRTWLRGPLTAAVIVSSALGLCACGDDQSMAEASTGCLVPSSSAPASTAGTGNQTGPEQAPEACDQLPGNDSCSQCLKNTCCDEMRRCYADERGCGCHAKCNLQARKGIASPEAVACVLLRGCSTPDLNLLAQVLGCGRKCAGGGDCTLPEMPEPQPGSTGGATTENSSAEGNASTSSTEADKTTSTTQDSSSATQTSNEDTNSTTQQTNTQETSSTSATDTPSNQETTSTTSSQSSTNTQTTTTQETSSKTGATDTQSTSKSPGTTTEATTSS